MLLLIRFDGWRDYEDRDGWKLLGSVHLSALGYLAALACGKA
jgi:hypothetical protein